MLPQKCVQNQFCEVPSCQKTACKDFLKKKKKNSSAHFENRFNGFKSAQKNDSLSINVS